MKYSITAFFVMLFTVLQTNGQGLTIIYESSVTKYIDVLIQEVPEISQADIRKRHSFVVNKGVSRFSTDSLYIASFPDIGWQSIFSFRNIYKNYNEDTWILQSGDYQEGYAVSKKLSYISENRNYNWKITNEQKQIIGIICTKAISEQGTTTAWFAPGLPYPDGPHEGVFNLPGLVLYLETPNEKWEAIDLLIHDAIVEVPAFNLVQNDNKITVSWNEIRSLGADRVIQINKNTPKGQWLKFEK